MSKGRTVLIKFEETIAAPGRGRLSANRVRAAGVGVVVEKGNAGDMDDRMYELGSAKNGYFVWVNTTHKVGDKVAAEDWMTGVAR